MSEATKAHIGRVVPRWQAIEAHIRGLIRRPGYAPGPALTELFRPRFENGKHLKSLWQVRTEAQVLDIHWAAYHLDPANHMVALDENTLPRVMNFIKKYVVDLDPDTAVEHFFDFKMRHGRRGLLASDEIWSKQNKPLHFWRIAQVFVPQLAILAQRVFNTPANSVPSERSFSVQNLLHSKTRNRLTADRAEKLEFIYINVRTLRNAWAERQSYAEKVAAKKKAEEEAIITNWLALTEAQELDIENENRAVPEAVEAIEDDEIELMEAVNENAESSISEGPIASARGEDTSFINVVLRP